MVKVMFSGVPDLPMTQPLKTAATGVFVLYFNGE